MSWLPVSKLPVMLALREVNAKPPMALFGPAAKPRSHRQAGRRSGSTKKVLALLAREKNLTTETRQTPGIRLARPELGLPIVQVKRAVR